MPIKHINQQPIYQDVRRYFSSPIRKTTRGLQVFRLFTGYNITLRNWTALPILSSVINIVTQIALNERNPYVITFYDHKGNPNGDYDINIVVVEESPDIIGVY